MSHNLLVGARLKIFINGKPLAKVANFDYTETSPQRVIHGIDTLVPIETSPGSLGITGGMTIYRQLHDGGIEGAGMKATWDAATRGKYFSILIVDWPSDTIVFESYKNSISSQSWNIPSRGFMTGKISFSGLLYGNGTESPV